MRRLTIDKARRLALAAQGFADSPPRGRVDRRHIRRVMGRLGLLQLDSVNVCVRSHYMPLFSRLGPYRRSLIDEMAYEGSEYFEYWGHEASLLPVEAYGLFHHRMEAWKPGRWYREVVSEHPGYLDAILGEVADRGPITAGELEDGGERTGPWWGYGRGKKALEWLFATGRVACAHRRNFTRYYDLTERVIPAEILAEPPVPRPEALRRLILLSVRSHGVGAASDLADYYRLKVPEVRPILAGLVTEGLVEEVEVEGWDRPAYADPAAAIPRRIEGAALLTPFDPVVWDRARTERLFGFHYRIEIYVPEAKRRYGYYVYPFMLDGDLVGRVDLKADRSGGRLLARGTFAEEGVDRARVGAAMAAELESMASWLDLGEVEVINNGDLASSVRRALG